MLRMIRELEAAAGAARRRPAASVGVGVSAQADPAKLPGLVRGELDWIVMKRARQRPWPTIRHGGRIGEGCGAALRGGAVRRPPTLGYRLRKVLRRNRAR